MKNYTLELSRRKIISDMAILFIILSGISYIIFAFMNFYKRFFTSSRYYGFLHEEITIVNRDLCITIGCILIFLGYRLYKKIRIAWIAIIATKIFFLLSTFIMHSNHFDIFIIADFIIILVLMGCSSDFNKKPDIANIRKAAAIAFISFCLLIFNTTFRLIVLKTNYKSIFYLKNELFQSFQMIYLINLTYIVGNTKITIIIEKFIIVMSWACIILAIYLLMKPKTLKSNTNVRDKNKVRELLTRYSYNSVSYFSIDSNVQYYFGNKVEGVIAYLIKNEVAVCVGDPICDDNNIDELLQEFMYFCDENELSLCFCHTTEKYLDIYKKRGFGIKSCGNEAIFDFFQYDFKLSGKKGAKVRESVNRANRENIKVIEYKPHIKIDEVIEKEIDEISKEWLTTKHGGELAFLLGNANMKKIGDKRIFLAMDKENKVQAFVIFNPFYMNNGYLADVTRKRKNAPHGIMEKIIISAFEQFKNEGIQWGSLGMVPLCHLKEKGRGKGILISMSNILYEKNMFFNFNSLYNYKNKFAPTAWQSRFIVYNPRFLAPKIVYSIIKAIKPESSLK